MKSKSTKKEDRLERQVTFRLSEKDYLKLETITAKSGPYATKGAVVRTEIEKFLERASQ